MRHTRDTFLHFLADNLTMNVHPLRKDPNNPSLEELRENAVSVKFMNVSPIVGVTTQQVAIHIIHTDENTAVDWTNDVFTLLNQAYMTPLYDYSIPASPTALNANIFWRPDQITFRHVDVEFYAHFVAVFDLHTQTR